MACRCPQWAKGLEPKLPDTSDEYVLTRKRLAPLQANENNNTKAAKRNNHQKQHKTQQICEK
jgi:hypothetical protein